MAYNFSSWYPHDHAMQTADKAIYTTALFLSVFNFILITFCLPITFQTGKAFHINFRILRLNIILSYYSFTIGMILLTTVCLMEETIVPEKNYTFFLYGFLFEQMGTHWLRCLWIAVFIERTVATTYSNSYELKKCLTVTFLLPTLSFIIALSFTLGRLIFVLNETYLHLIRSITDSVGVFTICFLYQINKKLRKITFKSKISLSQRYQITENIRVFKLILPILLLGVFNTTFGTFCAVTNLLLPFIHEIYRYLLMSFYLTFLVHITIVLFIWLRSRKVSRFKVVAMIAKMMNKKRSIIEPISQSTIFPKLKNVEGNTIVRTATIDEHFGQLAQMWK